MDIVASSNSEEVGQAAELLKKIKIALAAKHHAEAMIEAHGAAAVQLSGSLSEEAKGIVAGRDSQVYL